MKKIAHQKNMEIKIFMEQKNRPYSKKIENGMKFFYKSLNEKDQRHYAAIEAYKLGSGYISYIAELFSCSRQTLYTGLKELEEKDFLDQVTVRREGGGRKDILKKSEVEEVFLSVIEEHIAGDPMNDTIRWVKLTLAEISEKMKKLGIKISRNNETAEFVCDSIEKWWITYGVKEYINAKKILILCDAGGANSYRHNIFKIELQKLSTKINMTLQVSHYPPYTSKWNPIEHRVFPHVTRSMEGIPINTVEEARKIIKSTKTGLAVTSNIIKKTYEKGKEVAKDFMENMKIKFDIPVAFGF